MVASGGEGRCEMQDIMKCRHDRKSVPWRQNHRTECRTAVPYTNGTIHTFKSDYQ